MIRGTSFIWEGITIGGVASAPERDHMAERSADRVAHSSWVKEMKLSPADVDRAERFGLLQADYGTEIVSLVNGIGGGLQRVYSRRKLAERVAEFKALAKVLK
jgi:hypothetical protein